jgi:hypothetical protein
MDRYSFLNVATWDVYVVTDRSDTASSRERRMKWTGNCNSNPSRSIRYCGELIRISDDSDQTPLNQVHSHLKIDQNIQRVQIKWTTSLTIKTVEIPLAQTMARSMPIWRNHWSSST